MSRLLPHHAHSWRTRFRLRSASRIVFALALAAALLAGSAGWPGQRTPAALAVGYVDPRYSYTLEVPEGWRIEPTPADSDYGVAVLYNHDPELLERSPSIPVPNPIKIQIGIGSYAPAPTFADWLAQRIMDEFNADRGVSAASQPQPVMLGSLSGQAFLLQGGTSPQVLEMDFPVGNASALSIGITPADSGALDSALKVLDTLRLPPELTPALPANPEAGNNLGNSPAPLAPLLSESKTAVAAAQAECTAGAYSGNEAPTSPIELWMPFRDGETWTVGGGGAFYGSYFHCNLYNDYYATDWNRPNDFGADVLPVADGTVVAIQGPPCPNTGYGCYITLNHASGVRTLYGHLSGIFVSVGDTVTHWTKIGEVGNSGNSTGAHLHLRFQTSLNGTYYSHCYNNNQTCPNGEAPQAPQSPRPSPMNTQSGPVILQNGATYTSNNRQPSAGCPTVSGEVVVYDLVNCGGENAEATGPGLWTMEGSFNDRIESVAIPSGWSARLYLDNSTESPSVCLSATITDLRNAHYSNGQTAENSATWLQVFDEGNCAAQKPDLTPFPLPNRADPVIAADTAGTNANSPLFAARTVYMDWGLKNVGQGSAGSFYVDLYIDSQRYIHYPFPSLDPGQTTGFPDWAEVWQTPGWHTITVIVDAGNAVSESDEGNNTWTGQFYWQPSNPRFLPIIVR
jgi:murein DD-endopeptidase MepM/ murein hydrolase activator NlpD